MPGVKGGGELTVTWTVRGVLNWTRGYFEDAGIVQPRLEAETLLAHVLRVDRLHLYLSPDQPLTLAEREGYRTAIQSRRSGTPLQHLIGEVPFLGLRFRVGPQALIPRPETEELVEKTLRLAPREREISCLDLGTGCGVIAVSLARYLPRARVTAVDLSPEALTLARENAALNGVLDRILFLESDWTSALDGDAFDLVVSNPPYLPRQEIAGLATEVRDHEPRMALDGGEDGTDEIARIARGLYGRLRAGGTVLLEIGDGQGETVVAHLAQTGFLGAAVERDLAGKERFVIVRCP